jgi:hypothetical protein
MNTVMNLQIPCKIWNLFASLVTVSFSKRTLYDSVSQSVSQYSTSPHLYICYLLHKLFELHEGRLCYNMTHIDEEKPWNFIASV